ncbi:hypothetical protein SLEP1_g55757 [Rubroshorea leprosula]|uniref:Uncharacterized protein n=1 Tax=Rubroshorea leprosula TaxID=152421 RepID=A0AAV5MGH5_9ROSI|nr:hypothetical protein SLEP1_g55757 [Rubroshorea leprosula]
MVYEHREALLVMVLSSKIVHRLRSFEECCRLSKEII